MASYYVWSGAVGAANGTSWADAYTTLATALSGKAAADIFYVAHDHNETTASTVTLALPWMSQILCVNRAGSVPPVGADMTTGAQIKTSGNNHIQMGSSTGYLYGITFEPGNGASGTAEFRNPAASNKFENCHFKLGSTGGSSVISCGLSLVRWVNCTVEFSSTSQSIAAGNLVWLKTPSAIVGATIPTTLINANTGAPVFIEGVDLSAVPSGKTIISSNTSPGTVVHVLKDCKLASGVTVAAVPGNWTLSGVDVVRCDSGATNYRHERYHGVGLQTAETTIVRTGGASDGTTPIAWRIVTSAGTTVALPFESMPISVWNDTTGGTKTITVEGIWGGGAVPDNNDIWIEVEYLGSASNPQGSYVSSGVATILTTPSSYASSPETWGGSTTAFKMSVTTGTINQKGPITVRIYAGLASSTFYVCPKVTVV